MVWRRRGLGEKWTRQLAGQEDNGNTTPVFPRPSSLNMHPLLTFLKVIYILQTDKWINKNHICKTKHWFCWWCSEFCVEYERLVVHVMSMSGGELFLRSITPYQKYLPLLFWLFSFLNYGYFLTRTCKESLHHVKVKIHFKSQLF